MKVEKNIMEVQGTRSETKTELKDLDIKSLEIYCNIFKNECVNLLTICDNMLKEIKHIKKENILYEFEDILDISQIIKRIEDERLYDKFKTKDDCYKLFYDIISSIHSQNFNNIAIVDNYFYIMFINIDFEDTLLNNLELFIEAIGDCERVIRVEYYNNIKYISNNY